MISAMEDSTRVTCPADGSGQSGGDPGHMERYSPPGPNLHAGSIRPILCVFIRDTLPFPWSLTPALPVLLLSAVPLQKPKQKPNKTALMGTFLRKPTPPNYPPPLYGTHDEKSQALEAGLMHLPPLRRRSSRRDAETQRVVHSSRPLTARVIPSFITASPKFSR